MEPFPTLSMSLSRTCISTSALFIGFILSASPAFAAYRGFSHDAPNYDDDGVYHSSVLDRTGTVSVCTEYDERGRCLRSQMYRNTNRNAVDRATRTTTCTSQRKMDHTYIDANGHRQYDPRFYRVYDCGTQFRPERCDSYYR